MSNNELFTKLWNSCNRLRGRFDPSEYKYVILTIIFLKFASDTYELKLKELKKRKITSKQDIEEELAQFIKVPTGYHWNDIMNHTKTGDVHVFIDSALEKYENNNLKLKNLWRRFGEKFDKNRESLSAILTEFSSDDFGQTIEQHRDILGAAYEYFLKQFGEASGKKAGEFYTPKTIVELMVEILSPKKFKTKKAWITMYDPTAGSGGMFVQSAKLSDHNKEISFCGQEINEQTYTLAQMNLAIRGLDFDLGDEPDDTLKNDHFAGEKYDLVIANPPFNLKIDKNTINLDDARWKYGIPGEQKANYYFMQHMIDKMNDKGRMAVLLDNGSQTSNASKKIRENILGDDLYEAIIELPQSIFYGTSIAATLYVLNKDKKNKGKVLFIDAKKEYEKHGIVNELTPKNIAKIIKVYNDFQEGQEINIKNFAIEKSNDEIISNNANLSPRQYISEDIKEIDHKNEYHKAISELRETISDINNDFTKLLKSIDEYEKY